MLQEWSLKNELIRLGRQMVEAKDRLRLIYQQHAGYSPEDMPLRLVTRTREMEAQITSLQARIGNLTALERGYPARIPITADTVANLSELARWHMRTQAMVWSVAFDPTGRMLVAGAGDFHSNNDTMQIWRVDDGALLRTIILSGYMGVVSSVAFDADEHTLLSGESNMVRMWHLDSEAALHTFVRNLPTIDSLAFAPGGKTFASSHTVARKGAVLGGEIRLWRRTDSALLGTFSVHTNPVWSLAFAPDGVLLASGSDDTTVQVWQTKAIKHVHTLRGHTAGIRSVAFSPDGVLLASGALDRTVRLWRVADGALLGTLRGPNVRIRSVAFSPDGTLLVCGGQDGTIQLWHLAEQVLLGTLHGHTAKINSLTFAPGGVLLASGADDGTVRLWGIAGTDQPASFSQHEHQRLNT